MNLGKIEKGEIIAVHEPWDYSEIPVLFMPGMNEQKAKRPKRSPFGENAPHMVTIKELAQETSISEYAIRKLCATNQITYIKSGTKFLINYNKFIEYLNGNS